MFRTCGCRQPKRCERREKRHVTLDRGEMGGYDWLFSDVTDCESSQLEAITRCLVTPSASPPQRCRLLLLFPLSALRQHFVSVSLISFRYKTITRGCLLTFFCGCCPVPVFQSSVYLCLSLAQLSYNGICLKKKYNRGAQKNIRNENKSTSDTIYSSDIRKAAPIQATDPYSILQL